MGTRKAQKNEKDKEKESVSSDDDEQQKSPRQKKKVSKKKTVDSSSSDDEESWIQLSLHSGESEPSPLLMKTLTRTLPSSSQNLKPRRKFNRRRNLPGRRRRMKRTKK